MLRTPIIKPFVFLLMGFVFTNGWSKEFLFVATGTSIYDTPKALFQNISELSLLHQSIYKDPNSPVVLFGHGKRAKLQVLEEWKAEEDLQSYRAFQYLFELPGCSSCFPLTVSLTPLSGAATKSSILQQINNVISKKKGSDLAFYFSGHGKPKNKNDYTDNQLLTWGGESLSATELANSFEELPGEASVQLLLTQCYAGGFAQLLFAKASRANKLTHFSLCGFFASSATELASGCDPTQSYQKNYTHHFLQAHQLVNGADSDRDNQVSAAEAHNFVIRNSRAQDVPVKTSEIWLKIKYRSLTREERKTLGRNVLALASKAQGQLLRSLIDQLAIIEIFDRNAFEYLDEIESQIHAKLRPLKMKIAEYKSSLLKEARELSQDQEEDPLFLSGRPPLIHPTSGIYPEETHSFFKLIRGTQSWENILILQQKMQAQEKAMQEQLLRLSRTKRLKNLIENIIFEQRLFKEAGPQVQRDYKRILECEDKSFF